MKIKLIKKNEEHDQHWLVNNVPVFRKVNFNYQDVICELNNPTVDEEVLKKFLNHGYTPHSILYGAKSDGDVTKLHNIISWYTFDGVLEDNDGTLKFKNVAVNVGNSCYTVYANSNTLNGKNIRIGLFDSVDSIFEMTDEYLPINNFDKNNKTFSLDKKNVVITSNLTPYLCTNEYWVNNLFIYINNINKYYKNDCCDVIKMDKISCNLVNVIINDDLRITFSFYDEFVNSMLMIHDGSNYKLLSTLPIKRNKNEDVISEIKEYLMMLGIFVIE